MKHLISHVRRLFNRQLVHLFSNSVETARYNMIIHVIVFLVILSLSICQQKCATMHLCISHLNSLIVQAVFYNDAAECLVCTQAALIRSPAM